MIEFYLCSRSQSTGAHIIHLTGCPMLDEGGIWLGIFDNAHKAVLEGMKYFSKVKLCPFCLRESIKKALSGKVPSYHEPGAYIRYEHLIPAWDSSMLCGKN